MTRLVLIRHGQTAWNKSGKYQGQSDVALSEEGLEQARCLAEHFPVEKLDAVYASDLSRAMVTAETVAQKFGLEVRPEPAFRELSFGKWEGLTYAEIVAGWPEAMANFLTHPDIMEIPQGESFPQVQQRAMARLKEIVAEHEPHDHTVGIFAHGAVLRTILTGIMQMPLSQVWTLSQYNTAVNIVRFDEGRPTVELLNSTAHLAMEGLSGKGKI
ncbi:histidine phosphatase family protein [Selenomonas sp. AB3002]|uniref:histidine phosphatase family protein n=1 Tax=Selenomonas sp. AB3002 TaxID=1392502 RepID=UPI0004968CC8